MKLATLRGESRDGDLIVVNRDLNTGVRVPHIAANLQAALDNWADAEQPLADVYEQLNAGDMPDSFPIVAGELTAPLPRCYQFLDGSVYPNHMAVIRKARGDSLPEDFYEKPLLYQGMSHEILGPYESLLLPDDAPYGVDFEAEVVVITDDVPMGVSREEASGHIKLIGLLNDFSLRAIIPPEIGRKFGFMQGKPANALGPFVVTPEELGESWNGGLLSGRYLCELNGEWFGELDPGKDNAFDYLDLIVHATLTRGLCAGTVIGAGALGNEDRSTGTGCIAEKRAREFLDTGEATSPFMKFGDVVRLEMFHDDGRSMFGAIEQTVIRA